MAITEDAELPILPVEMERHPGIIAMRAEIERLRAELSDAKEDAVRLHGEKMRFFNALLEMRCRDDRNGSLHQNYRNIIDQALDPNEQ